MEVKMSKAVESAAGLFRAVEIWKELAVGKVGAENPKAFTEAELSVKTWMNCNSENSYWNHFHHYRRLNGLVMRSFWNSSKTNGNEYPALARYDGRIGKLTKAVAVIDSMKRVRCGATNVAKAMAINEGKKLGLNIASEFTNKTYTELVAIGEDPKLAAEIAIEGMRVAKETQLLEDSSKQEIFKGVAVELVDILNKSPALTARDEIYSEVFGDKDSLSSGNPNVKKKDEKDEELF
jgi:hypothetical protein